MRGQGYTQKIVKRLLTKFRNDINDKRSQEQKVIFFHSPGVEDMKRT